MIQDNFRCELEVYANDDTISARVSDVEQGRLLATFSFPIAGALQFSPAMETLIGRAVLDGLALATKRRR